MKIATSMIPCKDLISQTIHTSLFDLKISIWARPWQLHSIRIYRHNPSQTRINTNNNLFSSIKVRPTFISLLNRTQVLKMKLRKEQLPLALRQTTVLPWSMNQTSFNSISITTRILMSPNYPTRRQIFSQVWVTQYHPSKAIISPIKWLGRLHHQSPNHPTVKSGW